MNDEWREIHPPQDFETGQPREGALRYDVTWPEGRARGLVFVIPGFGGDTDERYARRLRHHIAKTHNMAAASVRYHCIGAREAGGATRSIGEREHLMLVGLAAMRGVRVDDPRDLDEVIFKLAAAGEEALVHGVLEPARGERQTFGLLQAMDHLAALGDMLEHGPAFDPQRVVAFGSSHGGYIAHMMAKIAPRSLAAVIDNSGYVQPPMAYLGIGTLPEVVEVHEGLQVLLNTRSAWTVDDRAAPNFYDRNRDLIRDMGFPPHLAAMRKQAGLTTTRYAMFNAGQDTVSDPTAKARQARALAEAGFEAQLRLVGEGDIDGAMFKRFTHALDASLKTLFDHCAPDLASRKGALDAACGASVAYDCVDIGYRFTHGGRAPYVVGETYDLFADTAPNRSRVRPAA